MTPFQGLRLWGRRAPRGERAAALLSAAVVLSLLGYVVVPALSGGSTANGGFGGVGPAGAGQRAASAAGHAGGLKALARSGAPAATPSANGSTTGAAAVVTGGNVSGSVKSAPAITGNSAAGSTGNGAATGKQGCTSPPGTDQGVTSRTVKVAVILVDVAGSANNTLFGTPSPDVQKQWYQYVIDALNATGGVACRHIVAQYFSANPLEQASLHQTCLDVVNSQPFFVMDLGAYFLFTSEAECYPQNHLPFVSSQLVPNAEKERYYPYLFGQAIADNVYRNAILALHQRGFFSSTNGFAKLGFIYRSCDSSVIAAMESAIAQAGIGSDQLVTFNVGCPSGFANPADLQQAVLKFKTSGVTNVTMAEMGPDFGNFTNIAEQQGFRPKYGLAQDSIVPTTYSSAHGNYANIANAIAITPDRFGEEHTPGYRPTAGTKWCNKIFAAHHVTDVYHQPDSVGGGMCDELQLFSVALAHAPAVQRNALAAGLAASRSIDFAFPFGPSEFTGPRPTTGGQFWRTLQFYESCRCWRVVDRKFHPSF